MKLVAPLKKLVVAGCVLIFAAVCVCFPRELHAVGATTPFINYEAESGFLGGGAAIIYLTNAPTTQYSSPELEASGHAYVQLTGVGQYVQWTNTTGQNITAINLRSCIPDAPAGGGISNTIDLYVNGVFRQAFSVNSEQNYCYEGTNYNGQTDKDPADGDPRGFWNDTHAFVQGGGIAPGETFAFRMDSSNTASFYYIDVVDVENPPAPLAQPANSISITDSAYGAISNNIGVDNTTAINNCFQAALSQGKAVYVPPGTYYFSAINGGLNASGIRIVGAGPWYSILYRITPANNNQGVANIITTISCTMSNLALDCNGNSRAGNNNNGAVNFSGNNWLVDNVWIQHVTSAFWCAGIGGTARNCRVLSVWSDGGNFNNVQGQGANGVGMSLTYSNNFVRGTGDDAMAINSVNYNTFGSTTTYYTMMSNIVYSDNTAIAPWGGKCMAIYGGVNQTVTNNLLCDTARYIGLGVGKFGVNGSDLLSARVTGNIVRRCGGNGYNQEQPAMMIGNGGDGQSSGTVANAYCASNTIIDSVYSAVGFSTCTNIVFQYNTIINPALDGIAIGPPYFQAPAGFAILISNTVSGLNAGMSAFTNYSTGFDIITPIGAANCTSASGMTVEPCAEGGQDIGNTQAGDWSAYNELNLTGDAVFVARVAGIGAAGDIEIHLDSPTGTLAGICSIPGTGGSQFYVDAFCALNGANGTHNVYLVYTGGNVFNVESFGFFPVPLAFSHQLVPGNTYSLKALVNGRYVTAPNNGTNSLIATNTSVGTAEQFLIVDAGGGNIAFEAAVNGMYVTAENDGASPLIANRTGIGSWETFTEFDAGGGNIAIRAMNDGDFVSAANGGNSPLIAQSPSIGTEESFGAELVSGVPPASPNHLAVAVNNSQVALNWLASPGASGYNVKRSTVNGGPYAVIATNLAATSYSDSGLSIGTAYYYVVSAENVVGESGNSSQAIAVPGTLDRLAWAALSSTSGSDSPANALDGDLTTRWSTDALQASGQWFEVDTGATNTFNKIVLNAVNSANDYPRGYQVSVSNDGFIWSSPVATGTGSSSVTSIIFSSQAARFIRVTQTGSSTANFWSIDEFYVFGAAPFAPTGLTASPGSAQASLSWNGSAGASGYNLKRSSKSGGPYALIAQNVTGLAYADTGLSNGTTYYYVVSATNVYGESANSIETTAHPVSTTSPQMVLTSLSGQLRLNWPGDHLGWRLQSQTNAANSGLGTNWMTVPNSTMTNQLLVPISPSNGSVFFRLVYP
jgi:hypothetical protein